MKKLVLVLMLLVSSNVFAAYGMDPVNTGPVDHSQQDAPYGMNQFDPQCPECR